MAVTAKRNNMRLLAIVLGEESGKVRNKETQELLDYGFNLYEVKTIYKKNEIVKKVKIDKGTEDTLNVISKKNINYLVKKDEEINYKTKIKIDKINLPIKKNQIIGKLYLYAGDKIINTYDLVADKNIEKKNIFKIYVNNLREYVNGNIK